MDQHSDPSDVFNAMHHRVTGELLLLMDGLYSNVEDGLFELAFRARQEDQHRRCFDLMREMRFQRSRVIQNFARRMQSGFVTWLSGRMEHDGRKQVAYSEQAQRMAQKCTAHFGGILQSLAERAAYALSRDLDSESLPMGPYQIACHFIESMKALNFDEQSIEIVESLFSRFVLERLGSVYGECNQHLEHAGYNTIAELDAVSSIRA